MRYPPSHKHDTRRRIVAAASAAFRERGVAETGVDDVMRRAGLTHGGFYAHFRDKSELVSEACSAAFADAVPNLERIAAQPTAARRARMLIDSYLAAHHRDHRGSGCVVVSVGADMARLGGAARGGYAQGFMRHLDRLAAALRLSADAAENRERVTLLMSSLVGALLFARAIDDPAQSDAILLATRRRLRAEYCREPARSAALMAQREDAATREPVPSSPPATPRSGAEHASKDSLPCAPEAVASARGESDRGRVANESAAARLPASFLPSPELPGTL